MTREINKRIDKIIVSYNPPEDHNVLWLHPKTHILLMWANEDWIPITSSTHGVEYDQLQTNDKTMVGAINELYNKFGLQHNLSFDTNISSIIEKGDIGYCKHIATVPSGSYITHAHYKLLTHLLWEQWANVAIVVIPTRVVKPTQLDYLLQFTKIENIYNINESFVVDEPSDVYIVTCTKEYLEHLIQGGTPATDTENVYPFEISQIMLFDTTVAFNSLLQEIVYFHQQLNLIKSQISVLETKLE